MVKQTVQDYMLNWLFLYNNRALQVSFPDTDIRSSCTLSVSMRWVIIGKEAEARLALGHSVKDDTLLYKHLWKITVNKYI